VSESFRGWPVEALDFYAKLEANNSRDWWLANKPTYDECVKAPFLALSPLVEREFGPLHLFRPNRDTRFAKDKSPYKTAAAAVTESEGGASYYVQISAEGLYVGSGYYHLQPDQLERYRAAVADNRKGPQFATAVEAVRKLKYSVESRDALKRVPRGFDADHPRAELLKRKGMHVGRIYGAPRWLHSTGALDRIVTAWRDAKPVNRWLDRHVGPSQIAPPEPD
jgi:uncharacterized protein (TIGR02453 family)